MAAHRLHVLDCGTLTFPREGIYFAGGTEIITVPIPAYLIEHPEGNVVYDTGYAIEAIDDHATLGEALATYVPGATRENHIREQVKAAGFDPDDVRYIIQTHLHFDHVGAIGEFPKAEFLCHQADWDYAHHADWFIGHAYPLSTIDKPDTTWKFIDTPEDAFFDVYGDERIRLTVSPGHSPGMLSAVLRLDGQNVVLTGDAVVTIDHWNNEALPWFLDAPAVARSTARLHRIAEEENAMVIFGHDAAQQEGLPKVIE